jgi:hypothetical protein
VCAREVWALELEVYVASVLHDTVISTTEQIGVVSDASFLVCRRSRCGGGGGGGGG